MALSMQRSNLNWLSPQFQTTDATPGRLGEIVIDQLTRAIVEGDLQPGDALPSEGQIAASFGVSKPIAREALRNLAAQGLVHVQQGKVSRVRGIDAKPLSRFFKIAVGTSAKGLSEAVELRRMIEPPVARLAALRRTAQQLGEFSEIVEKLEASMGDVARWIEADLAFHRHLAVMAANQLVLFQIEALEPMIREMMLRFNTRKARGPEEWRITFDRHAVIAESIHAGADAAAAASMELHFAAAEEAIAEIFGGSG